MCEHSRLKLDVLLACRSSLFYFISCACTEPHYQSGSDVSKFRWISFACLFLSPPFVTSFTPILIHVDREHGMGYVDTAQWTPHVTRRATRNSRTLRRSSLRRVTPALGVFAKTERPPFTELGAEGLNIDQSCGPEIKSMCGWHFLPFCLIDNQLSVLKIRGIRCAALSEVFAAGPRQTPQKLESFFALFAALNLAVIDIVMRDIKLT